MQGVALDGETGVLFDLMERKGTDRLTSSVWAKAVKHDDQLAVKLIDDAVKALGAAIATPGPSLVEIIADPELT